jgi:hypothetical protein
MSKQPAIYATIRHVVSEFGGSDELANALRDRVGDDFLDAVQDQRSEYRDDDPPPSRLGHSESEAAIRWCAFAREVTPTGPQKLAAIGNRFIDHDGSAYSNPAACNCIGGYCMSWRWLDDLRGFCGLAGRPTHQPLREPRRLSSRTPLERPTPSECRDLFDE